MNSRTQRSPFDRPHIAYTRRSITTVIEFMVWVNESRGTETHNQQHYKIFRAPRDLSDMSRYLWNIPCLILIVQWKPNRSTYTYRTVINTACGRKKLDAYIYEKGINGRQSAKQKSWLWQGRGERYYQLQIYLISPNNLRFSAEHTEAIKAWSWIHR